MADGEAASSASTNDRNIQWMYEGARSLVNREDYLLGKKIDKNFELYSDVVNKDHEEEEREGFFSKSLLHPSTSQQKFSALDTRVVRTEDPLVALKFQEDQRKRQMLENPLLKARAQRVLRKAFEKEMKRAKKKNKHKDGRKRSTSESEEEDNRKKNKRRESHFSDKRRSERRREEGEKRRGRSARRSPTPPEKGSKRGGDTSIRQSSNNNKTSAPKTKKKLTAEELEERRRAMMENANWRGEMREQNLKGAAEKVKKEQAEMSSTATGPSFIRPLLSSATEDSSIEKRLQSNRMNIQRQHDHMDKSFVRK